MKRLTKIKVKALFSFIFIILFQLIFCNIMWAFDKFAGEETMIVNKEQNGQEITVKTGNLIQIELAELGSAGYKWHILKHQYLEQYLELISEETKKMSEKGKIGVPIMRVWRFKAKKPGQTEIIMDYYRGWEGVKKSPDHFFIKINIIANKEG